MLGPRRAIQPHVIRGLKLGALCAVAVWVVIVAFSLNFSSIGMWDRLLPQIDKDHLVLGEPRPIRSDEWLVNSPIMLAYGARWKTNVNGIEDFAGPPGAELLMNQPAPHFTSLFRPQFWGFFLFDRDRAFSALYATKLVALGFVFFCITLLLCESAVIALCATIWLCFSSFFQWWFSICLPEIVATGLLSALAAWVLLYTRSRLTALGSAVVLVVSLVDFTMCVYPPFMVPVAHAALAIGIALTLKYGVAEGGALAARGALLTGSLSVFGAIMFLVYQEISPIIQIVQNTDYPGRRISVSGSFPPYRYLNNLADVFFTDKRFPLWLGNVCEAAGFIVVWPLVIPALLYRWLRKQLPSRELLLFVPLLLVLIGHLAWMSFDVPQWIGSVTGLFLAAGQRVYAAQGLLGILVVAMLSALPIRRLLNTSTFWWLGIASTLIAIVVGWSIEQSMPQFLSRAELTLLAVALGVAITGLLSSVSWMLWCPIVWLVLPNTFINPVSRGIRPITDRKILAFASKIGKDDPNSRWVVFGEGGHANLLKVAGVRVVNGVVYAPRLDDYRAFDMQGHSRSIYNRYAHVGVASNSSPETPASFHLIQNDSFLMKAHPCHPGFENIGVNYFVFTYKPAPHEVACLQHIGKGQTGASFRVFMRKRSTPQPPHER